MITQILEEELRENSMSDENIKNTKTNLKKKIERSNCNLNFIDFKRKLYI